MTEVISSLRAGGCILFNILCERTLSGIIHQFLQVLLAHHG